MGGVASTKVKAGSAEAKASFSTYNVFDVSATYRHSLKALAKSHKLAEARKARPGSALAAEEPPKPDGADDDGSDDGDRVATIVGTGDDMTFTSLFGVDMNLADFYDVFGPGSVLMVGDTLLSLPLEVFKMFDVDGTGKVPALELFLALALYSTGEMLERMNFCFEIFDEDGNMTLDPEEMMVLVTVGVNTLFKLGDLPSRPGPEVLKQVGDDMFELADASGEGAVTPAQFYEWAKKSRHSSQLIDNFNRVEKTIERKKQLDNQQRRVVWRVKRANHKRGWGGLVSAEDKGYRFETTGHAQTLFERSTHALKQAADSITTAERLAPKVRVNQAKLKSAAAAIMTRHAVDTKGDIEVEDLDSPERRRAKQRAARRLQISLVPGRPAEEEGGVTEDVPSPPKPKVKSPSPPRRPKSASTKAYDVESRLRAALRSGKPPSPTKLSPTKVGVPSPSKSAASLTKLPGVPLSEAIRQFDEMEPRQALHRPRNPLVSAVPLSTLHNPRAPAGVARIDAANTTNLRQLARASLDEAATRSTEAVPGETVSGVLTSPMAVKASILSPGTRGRGIRLRSPTAKLKPLPTSPTASASGEFRFFPPDRVAPTSPEWHARSVANKSSLAAWEGTPPPAGRHLAASDDLLWTPTTYAPPGTSLTQSADAASMEAAWQEFLEGSSCIACNITAVQKQRQQPVTMPTYGDLLEAKTRRAAASVPAKPRRRSGYGGRFRSELVEML